MKKLLTIILTLAIVLTLSGSAFAATIKGNVVKNGRIAVGELVTLKKYNAYPVVVKTNSLGNYQFTNVGIGSYSVTSIGIVKYAKVISLKNIITINFNNGYVIY